MSTACSLPQGFEWVETADGSPSLVSFHEQEPEVMHHRGGAFTETDYVYGTTLRRWLTAPESQGLSGHIVSLGLGLGYNEMFAVHEWLNRRGDLTTLTMESFESQEYLSQQFIDWVSGNDSVDLSGAYNQILKFFPQGNQGNIRLGLQKLIVSGRWKVAKALQLDQWKGSANIYLWDAFSRKASPDLWNEDLLRATFSRAALHEPVAVGTYACLGALKRALAVNDFKVEIREGFQGKRNCTFASRGM